MFFFLSGAGDGQCQGREGVSKAAAACGVSKHFQTDSVSEMGSFAQRSGRCVLSEYHSNSDGHDGSSL